MSLVTKVSVTVGDACFIMYVPVNDSVFIVSVTSVGGGGVQISTLKTSTLLLVRVSQKLQKIQDIFGARS